MPRGAVTHVAPERAPPVGVRRKDAGMGICTLRRRTATAVGVLVSALLGRAPVYVLDASTPRIPEDVTLFRSPRDLARAAQQASAALSRTSARP